MRRLRQLAASTLMLLTACVTTSIVDTWRASDFAGPPLRKVLVCALNKEDATRRLMEDAFVKELGRRGLTGVACYTIMPGVNPTEDLLRAGVATTGADGVFVTRLAGVSEVTTYGAGPAWGWGPLYPGWGPSAAYVWGPAYLQTDTLVKMLTKVYSAPEGNLIWFATSQTFNPTSVKSLVAEVAPKFAHAMTVAGVLPPAPKK